MVKRLKLKHIDCFIERRKRQYSRLTTSVCGEVIKNFKSFFPLYHSLRLIQGNGIYRLTDDPSGFVAILESLR